MVHDDNQSCTLCVPLDPNFHDWYAKTRIDPPNSNRRIELTAPTRCDIPSPIRHVQRGRFGTDGQVWGARHISCVESEDSPGRECDGGLVFNNYPGEIGLISALIL